MRKSLLCLLLVFSIIFTMPAALAEETRLRDFVDALMQGENNEALYAQFDEAMQSAISRSDFDRLWRQVSLLSGSFKAYVGSTDVSTLQDYTVLTQAMDMTGLDLLCTMSLQDDGLIAGLSFTIHPIPETDTVPSDITEEAIVIGEAPWELPGTLTLPENAENVPAVVLVHGSGPNDRDETIGAAKPFRDIAEALTQQGIATLRYDKRTYVYGAEIAASPEYASFTVEEETIQDTIAAGRLLAADKRIDQERIFLLGHSLGGMLVPRIAAESDGLFHGLIVASATNRSLADILLRQLGDSGTDVTALRAQVASIASMTADEARATSFLGTSAYYFGEMSRRPTAAEYLARLAMPTLIINGSRDFQVTEDEGRKSWESAFSMDEAWLTTLWTDVNHLLMRPAMPTGTADEYAVPCQVAEDITDAIAKFILNTEE